MRQGRHWVSLDSKLGLSLRDAVTQKPAWQRSMTDLLSELMRGAPSPEKNERIDVRLVAVLPETGIILVSTHRLSANRLGAFDSNTGAMRWCTSMRPGAYSLDRTDPVAEHAGRIWYTAGDVLVALSALDGHLVQRFRVGVHAVAIKDPVFIGDHVAFLYDEHLVKMSFADQRVDWRVPVGDDVHLRRGGSSDDWLIIGANTVRRISADGKILARRDGLGGGVHEMPVLVTRDATYLCSGSRAYALDLRSLRLLWTHDEASWGSTCPVAISAGQLLVTDAVRIAILDRTTGRVIARPSIGGLGDLADVLASQDAFCLFGASTSECVR